MAIPTDFSVTTAKVSPIPNPDRPLDAPMKKDAKDAAATNAPNVFEARPADPVVPPFPLNHARILYENKLFTYSSVTADGPNPEDAIKPNTYERWRFGASGNPTINFVLPENVDMDTFCLGAHNLNALAGTVSVKVRYSSSASGSANTIIADKPVRGRGSVFIHLSPSVSVRQLQIEINGGFGEGYIGYISAGIALQMQRPFFSGHTPMLENRDLRYYDAWTESGNLVARSRRAVKTAASFQWDNINDDWYRDYYDDFRIIAEELPFFIAWNLSEYPYDASMALGQNFDTSYNGTRNLRSVSFDARGPV